MKKLINMVKNVLSIIGLATIIFGVYLVTSGNITTKERTQEHNITIIKDGEVTSSKDWTEKMGYEIGINLYDETYIGK